MPSWINLIAILVGLVVSAFTGMLLIPYLKKLHFGQTILEIGPAWHKSKEGTPTMGGFMFLIGTLAALSVGIVLYYTSKQGELSVSAGSFTGLFKMLAGVGFALLNCLIGFIDDYIKVIKKRNLGLTSKQKLVMQFLFAAAYLFVLYILGDNSTSIVFPFIGSLDLGIFYYPIMILVMTYIVNAVNLTDGIDGLCGTVTVVAALAFSLTAGYFAEYEQSIFSAALAGACVGFLIWNLHPAKVFMGDTGSMFLGGAIVSFGMALHQHVLLIIIAIVYILEALSVVLQVISFKTTGKRIFKMSPIHHHFELCKWGEYKIVIVFSLVGLLAGAAAVFMACRYMSMSIA